MVQQNSTLTKLSSDLMKDLEDLRKGELNANQANLICRHSRVVMSAEHANLQYARIDERIARNIIGKQT